VRSKEIKEAINCTASYENYGYYIDIINKCQKPFKNDSNSGNQKQKGEIM